MSDYAAAALFYLGAQVAVLIIAYAIAFRWSR